MAALPQPQDDSITALGEMDPRRLGRDEFVMRLDAASSGSGELDLSQLSPEQFAVLVSRATGEQLKAVLERPALREAVLAEIFRRMSERYTGGTTTGVVRWRIDTGDELLRWECELDADRCAVTRDSAAEEPRATLTLPPLEFVKLTSGNATPTKLLMTGKLKVSGDLTFAAALPKLFDVPKP
ncbi:SCP2 sterol-binding domain-containing protein [Saccharopolyspora griseoalba]|uniref:SCP2 sterol-binding domain-containing protein n=1 Tax=Saccharopolyspora griseoalba TaxID=1431848 RepID=A0ABW2LM68_9PSEU